MGPYAEVELKGMQSQVRLTDQTNKESSQLVYRKDGNV